MTFPARSGRSDREAGAALIANNLGSGAIALAVGSLAVAGKLDLNNNYSILKPSPYVKWFGLTLDSILQGKILFVNFLYCIDFAFL